MELKNRSFQYRKLSISLLTARSVTSVSCVLCPLSQNLSWSRAPSILGTTELMFIEPGIKINGAYYRNVLLGQHLPAIRSIAGEFFTFQQDNAPAHRAGDTVEFLFRNTPDFISPLLWPPNSPDLNPVDYEVGACSSNCSYRSRIRDVDHLKQHLIEEWRVALL